MTMRRPLAAPLTTLALAAALCAPALAQNLPPGANPVPQSAAPAPPPGPVPAAPARVSPPVFAPPGQGAGQAQPDDVRTAIAKSNAYIGLLNRTMRASESWERYRSWVKSPSGPTGRERIVYGLYSLYDVRSEIAAARAAAGQPPAQPALDQAVLAFIDAYEEFSPVVAEAEGYYERKDYLVDKWAKAKDIHARLAPAATRYLAARKVFEGEMEGFTRELHKVELADIERREGREGRWQLRNVMIKARPVVEALPKGDRPVVDMAAFDAALADYTEAATQFDAWVAANPGKLSMFDSRPRSLLGKLRETREKLARAKGDARRSGAGNDLMWIVNDYNMMVSLSQTAARMMR